MVDVFISYSRNDQAMVAMLARAVEAAGYDVWWDAELPPHQSYGEVITEKIATTKAAIVVWSASAVKSEWVRAEADMARNQRKLIQTALDSVTPPLPFNQIQYAEMGDWRGEDDHPGWRKVKVSLAELCGQRATSEPSTRRAPPPPPPYHPQPAAAPAASRWPLFAGIGIAAVALAAAGGMLLGRGGSAPAPAVPAAAGAVAVPSAPAPAPAVEAPPAAAPAPAIAPAAPVQPAAAPAAPAAAVAVDTNEEAPSQPNPSDMTFADSSTRLLQPSEVASLGPTTLKIARNEIFARKGFRFQTPFLRDWFGRFAWYKPLYDQVRLNPIERQNIELIRQAEQRYQ
ncbi:MAG: YARHG domain-containing protein [Sphingomonadales bacterium]|nr:YARHG domain-containing protein [Sphingomonadales bacterium]